MHGSPSARGPGRQNGWFGFGTRSGVVWVTSSSCDLQMVGGVSVAARYQTGSGAGSAARLVNEPRKQILLFTAASLPAKMTTLLGETEQKS